MTSAPSKAVTPVSHLYRPPPLDEQNAMHAGAIEWHESDQWIDPNTPTGRQEAVNLAEMYLRLESARMYGLVSGGPKVNVERCEDILGRGRKLGYVPAPGGEHCERCLPPMGRGDG